MIYSPSPSCSSTRAVSPCYPAQVVHLTEFSNGKSVYIGEPLPYRFEPQPSHEGDDIPVDIPNEAHIRQFTSCMDSVGNVNW